MLTESNYTKGFLIDEELMGGVTEDADKPGVFAAYVLNHTTGEYLGYTRFESLAAAVEAVNAVKRAWKFEGASGCGACAEGTCTVEKGGACKKLSAQKTGNEASSCC